MRKIIQIAFDTTDTESELNALCDDGTLWYYSLDFTEKKRIWKQWDLPEIPQSKKEDKPND